MSNVKLFRVELLTSNVRHVPSRRGPLRMSRSSRLALVTTLIVATSTTLLSAAPASAAPANNDYCLGQCNDILPPGESGNATLAQILANKVLGTRPAHTDDQ